ncbi:ribbon-helix-helix protein, CopG family [Rhizobium sp. CG5]|uniref:ribbon-helix-helix domain-containing protein n=1 Tax=Rhizobium sp. CG5 TaxID=2726076 RepID=UPI00203414F3|nr:ribbon-helix-helix domain-containing protein [Rhizobium sp. CG5]MCM2475739.1 ribbon-helix-helix protein, CopG family [Rhizobium sp. CG5]
MLHLAKQQLTVYLDPDLAARIEALVAAGVYANASQVVQEALTAWQSGLDQREFELELKKVYERGLAMNGRDNANAANFLRAMGDLA